MTRSCDVCGREYVAKRPTSKYCGSGCRTKASRAPKPPSAVALPVTSGLVAAARRELEVAGRLDSMLGQACLALAARVASPHETGASVASLTKQLRETMTEALKGAAQVADPLDELRDRRDAKRAAG